MSCVTPPPHTQLHLQTGPAKVYQGCRTAPQQLQPVVTAHYTLQACGDNAGREEEQPQENEQVPAGVMFSLLVRE